MSPEKQQLRIVDDATGRAVEPAEAVGAGRVLRCHDASAATAVSLVLWTPEDLALGKITAEIELDERETFVYDTTIDLSALEPTVACHPDPGQRKLAREMTDMKLDRAYVGSCTGGKTSDFLAFAELVRGQEVCIDTFGVPATPEIVQDLQTTEWDGKSVWSILTDAGVRMTENAGCSACLGGPVDTFGRMNEGGQKCISATNRNFPGRMGSKESEVYLASPATVAASALAGHVADPREYLN